MNHESSLGQWKFTSLPSTTHWLSNDAANMEGSHARALDLLKLKVATFSDQASCTQDDHKKARNIKAECWREELEEN